MEAEKFHNLLSESWRLKKASGEIGEENGEKSAY
jgi:hypothetical protein